MDRQAIYTKLIAALTFSSALLYSAHTTAAVYEFSTDPNINFVQLQSTSDYATLCTSDDEAECVVPAGTYQLVTFTNGWRHVVRSTVEVADPNTSGSDVLRNVEAFIYGPDLVEFQFDQLPVNYYPVLRSDRGDLAYNGVNSSSLIFRGSDVLSGKYELLAASNGVAHESQAIDITLDLENRLASINNSSLAPDQLEAVSAYIYGDGFVEFQFDQLKADQYPEIRRNGEVFATNVNGSNSLILKNVAANTGVYELYLRSNSNQTSSPAIPVTLDFESRMAYIDEIRDVEKRAVSEVVFDSIEKLAGSQIDDLEKEVLAFSQWVESSEGASPEALESSEYVTTVRFRTESVTTEIERTRYQCSEGGLMIKEIGTLNLLQGTYTAIDDLTNYVFDQCASTVEGMEGLNGRYVITGSVHTLSTRRSGSRYNDNDDAVEWRSVEINKPDQLRIQIDGKKELSNSASAYAARYDIRRMTTNVYKKFKADSQISSIVNGYYSKSKIDNESSGLYRLVMQMDGALTASQISDHTYTFATDTPLNFENSRNKTNLEQKGLVTVQVSDGASMVLEPSPTAAQSNESWYIPEALVDWTSTTSEGNVESGREKLLFTL